jgi:hypothetical protein
VHLPGNWWVIRCACFGVSVSSIYNHLSNRAFTYVNGWSFKWFFVINNPAQTPQIVIGSDSTPYVVVLLVTSKPPAANTPSSYDSQARPTR